MSGDRVLATVLGAYQKPQNPVETNRIISTTTSLLTSLSNPLNVTLLTSQFLTAPAIWSSPNDLKLCLRTLSIFNTAAITVHGQELERRNGEQSQYTSALGCDDWARAVVKGADDRSPRWQHLLVIGGVLLGMESQDRNGLSRSLRSTLESAMVTAANLALENPARDGILGAEAIVLALNHAFPLLSNNATKDLNYDALAPLTIRAIISTEGYQGGKFLTAIDHDMKVAPNSTFDWPAKSRSFGNIQSLSSAPLVSSIGPLSRLAAHAIEWMRNPAIVQGVVRDLFEFSNSLSRCWRCIKLSEIDPSEESIFLTAESLQITTPVLWQLLKSAMFSVVLILRATISRTLVDPHSSADGLATSTASSALQILRNIYFISSRSGSNAFSAYTFVYLTSIDILARSPGQAGQFLRQIQPAYSGQIPSHPLDRNLDLYFLNTCEHLALIMSPHDNEIVIVNAASPYLNSKAHKGLLEIFESAHSAVLAVMAAPQNSDLTTRIIPFYTESLFSSFPSNLSPRQFRFAFKCLLQITAPPAPLSATQPLLSETLLELLHQRTMAAPQIPMPRSAVILDGEENTTSLSEQAVLMLALLDSLPYLTLSALEEWLPIAARLLNTLSDPDMRESCKARFWQILETGEMDVDRSAIAVAWWTSRGGREMVFFGRNVDVQHEDGPFMSGGLAARNSESHL